MENSNPKVSQKHRIPTSDEMWKLIESSGRKCQLTGVDLTPQNASFDHRVPVSKGGSDSIDNLMLVHKVVNTMKGNLTLEEFLDWCQKVTIVCPSSSRPTPKRRKG